MAQMAQQLNQANFSQAQGAAQQDIANRLTASQANQAAQQQNLNRNMQAQQLNQAAQQAKTNSDILAAQGLTNTGSAINQANVANYGMLTSAGAGQSQQSQSEINAQMAKFNQAFNYPNQQLNTLLSSLGITPHDTSTTGATTQTTQTSPDWGSIITGGLDSAANLAKMFNIGSDRSLKTDITQVDTHPSGVPIYTYRYKGDPKSYPKVMGPMAEDVAKIAPHAVTPMGKGGRLAVNMHTLNAFTPPPSPGVARGIQNMMGSGPMTPPSSPGVAKGIASMSAFTPNRSAIAGALSNPRAGAKAFGGLSNTKMRTPPIRGALAKVGMPPRGGGM
jgi:hypothetical protein